MQRKRNATEAAQNKMLEESARKQAELDQRVALEEEEDRQHQENLEKKKALKQQQLLQMQEVNVEQMQAAMKQKLFEEQALNTPVAESSEPKKQATPLSLYRGRKQADLPPPSSDDEPAKKKQNALKAGPSALKDRSRHRGQDHDSPLSTILSR